MSMGKYASGLESSYDKGVQGIRQYTFHVVTD